MRFEIGSKVWVADSSPMAVDFETCPDCGGTGRLRVTFHDDTLVSIECRNCAVGFDPPTGRVVVHRAAATVRSATVCGFEFAHGDARWHVDDSGNTYRIFADCDVFETEAEAGTRATEMVAQYEADQRARIRTKEKDTRTWAWNASYHRRCIKEAQRQIEYHTAKLNVAAIQAKEVLP